MVENFFDDATIEIREGDYGFFARVTDIDRYDVQAAIEQMQNTEYEYAVTETGRGLGMEIWSEDRKT